MKPLISIYENLTRWLDALAPVVLPTLARLVFAGVLLIYFWSSAQTKLAGPLTPSAGAYIQIFPRAIEAFGYDFSKLGLFHRVVVLAGTWAEFALPLLIVLGLLTRLAALGMVGFVTVQSFTDVLGHGVAGDDLGAWFDAASGALILDQRALWLCLLAVLVFKGAGPLSLDRLVGGRRVV
ncbi:MAG: DoxX family membrane protein [Pseudorhodobacter sp.]|nr:DoxX family membrane protein [Pseudorhodobacter sp.]